MLNHRQIVFFGVIVGVLLVLSDGRRPNSECSQVSGRFGKHINLTDPGACRTISTMKRTALLCILVTLAANPPANAQTAAPKPASSPAPAVRYGDNAAAGRTFMHDGVRFY